MLAFILLIYTIYFFLNLRFSRSFVRLITDDEEMIKHCSHRCQQSLCFQKALLFRASVDCNYYYGFKLMYSALFKETCRRTFQNLTTFRVRNLNFSELALWASNIQIVLARIRFYSTNNTPSPPPPPPTSKKKLIKYRKQLCCCC